MGQGAGDVEIARLEQQESSSESVEGGGGKKVQKGKLTEQNSIAITIAIANHARLKALSSSSSSFFPSPSLPRALPLDSPLS